MNDIRPPQRQPQPSQPTKEPLVPTEEPAELPDLEQEPHLEPVTKKRNWLKRLGIAALIAFLAALIVSGAVWFWYKQQLEPVAPGENQLVSITVVPGTDSAGLAKLLKEKDAIKNSAAFEWYVRLHRYGGKLQAGSYRINRGSDVPSIVALIVQGRTETFDITFLPGNTLAKHRKALLEAGFTKREVDSALAKQYDHPLLAGKPASKDLEGYIYGETYQFPTDVSVETILTRAFDEMYKVVKSGDLVRKYKAQGLSLYEGITLASIVQREVVGDSDQKLVAGVFYNRLKQDMNLGSDVTYQYIADKTGVDRDPNLDSPYNTRRYAGLPPGPIASPGKGALIAVGSPTSSDYLFFLSGDDDKTYFGRTAAEHEANIQNHCKKKCLIL
ncbi:MAG TPA: endolytic transglycosylase MltG [Candidatus Saccharibacteria bacterium]|nr:endolytic transglycosylase MltG [Candidatus Saccharibacteria bacterium]